MLRVGSGLVVLGIAVAACACAGACAGERPAKPASTDAPAATAADPRAIRLDGMGPVRFGMSVAEAREALHDSLPGASTGEGCAYVEVASAPGVLLMVENGAIVRVDVDTTGIATDRGATVGMTEEEIRTRYATGLQVMPHKYLETGHYLVFRSETPADSARRIVFETDGQVVQRYRAGLEPAVEYVEGCS